MKILLIATWQMVHYKYVVTSYEVMLLNIGHINKFEQKQCKGF